MLFSAQYEYGVGAFQRASADRALGGRTRWFDGLGQLRRWTDAKGQVFFADYDQLSRLTSQVTPETARTFVYGSEPSSYNVGQLRSQYSTTAGETYREDYLYDSTGRMRQQSITLPGESANPYVYDFTYDPTTGQLDTLTYPTSTSSYRFALKYNVNAGILTSIADANSPSTVYWALDTAAGGVNALGQITHDTLGPIVRRRSFDAVTGGLEQIIAGSGANATGLQNSSVNYDDFGNVFQRQNNLGNLTSDLNENFEYGEPGIDNVDRLTHIALSNGSTETRDLQYDAFGNIELLTTSTANTPTDLVPVDLSMTWTADNYPRSISAPWLGETVSFAYGPDQQRWRMVYQNGGASETTYYLGLMEKVVTGSGTEFRHYIPGPEEMIGLYTRASNGTNVLRYMLSDHLGSLDTIADSAGAALVRASYSAYGVPRDPLDWSGTPSATPDGFTRQGYTAQTVLGRMGLLHMNGRVHDAVSGTFISADPFIPDPTNTQSFNRYAYVYNNPLTFTDPSGFSPDGDDSCFLSMLCFIQPIIPPDFLEDDDGIGPWVDCFRSGGCRGMMFYLRNNSPRVAPQTATRKMDQKAVAKMASQQPSGAANDPGAHLSTVGGTGVGQTIINSTVPGAYYAGQAELAFREGHYFLGASHAVASLGDAALGVFTLGRSTSLTSSARTAIVALDTNAVIAAVERGRGAEILAGRIPIVSITAVKEFLRGGGSVEALRAFLVGNGGRVAAAGSETAVSALQVQAQGLGRVLTTADGRVSASAMTEGVPLITNDGRLTRFLRAIGFPVEGF